MAAVALSSPQYGDKKVSFAVVGWLIVWVLADIIRVGLFES